MQKLLSGKRIPVRGADRSKYPPGNRHNLPEIGALVVTNAIPTSASRRVTMRRFVASVVPRERTVETKE